MTDREEYLRERTFKGGRFNVDERTLNTLIDERKAFAWLVNHLHTKGILSVDDFDTMLFEARPPDAR
jgi:hypothetical protein